MIKRKSILIAALVILCAVAPAMAAPPLDVHIEVESVIDPADPTVEPFVATGPAVDSGTICPTGQVIDLSGQVSGPPEGSFINLKISKHFVCDDGSGTFDVKLVARIDLITGEAVGSWNIVEGTGAFAELHGSGKLYGIPIVLGSTILDIYDGKIH